MGRKSPKPTDGGAAEGNGVGEFVFPNNDRYVGEFSRNDDVIMRHGHGTLTTSAGVVYEGTWADDAMHGNGKLTFANGAVYEGTFERNRYHGNGTYTWANGCRYVGGFEGSKLQGEGQFKDNFEQTWVGSFHCKAAPGLKFKLNL